MVETNNMNMSRKVETVCDSFSFKFKHLVVIGLEKLKREVSTGL